MLLNLRSKFNIMFLNSLRVAKGLRKQADIAPQR